MTETNNAPSRLSLFQYGFMALPLAFAGLPLYIHAPDFYTKDLGLSIGLMGMILLGIRIFDAIQDPVIGYVSDVQPHNRFQIIMGGIGALTAGMAGLFYGPQMGIPTPVWFAVFMILATTGFSVVTININMIGGFWCDNDTDRTRISAWREGFGLGGLLLASILPAIIQYQTTAQISFIILFWTFAGLMIFATILFSYFINQNIKNQSQHHENKLKFEFLFLLFGCDRLFFLVCFMAQLAASIPAVLVLFFIRDYLGAEHLSGVFLILYFLTGAAFVGVWVKLSVKIGQYKTWLASMILAFVTFIWAFMLQPGDVIAFGFICALSGIALGANLTLPPAMVATRINNQQTEAKATQYYALLAFLPKVAMALAAGGAFMILDIWDFQAGQDNNAQALSALITIYALVPCLIKLCAAGLLWRLIKTEGY